MSLLFTRFLDQGHSEKQTKLRKEERDHVARETVEKTTAAVRTRRHLESTSQQCRGKFRSHGKDTKQALRPGHEHDECLVVNPFKPAAKPVRDSLHGQAVANSNYTNYTHDEAEASNIINCIEHGPAVHHSANCWEFDAEEDDIVSCGQENAVAYSITRCTDRAPRFHNSCGQKNAVRSSVISCRHENAVVNSTTSRRQADAVVNSIPNSTNKALMLHNNISCRRDDVVVKNYTGYRQEDPVAPTIISCCQKNAVDHNMESCRKDEDVCSHLLGIQDHIKEIKVGQGDQGDQGRSGR